MNQPSVDKFGPTIVPDGVIVIDSALTNTPPDRDDIKVFMIPATEIAEKAGFKVLANMVCLGKLWKETGFCDEASLEPALRHAVPAKHADMIDKNLEALRLGMTL